MTETNKPDIQHVGGGNSTPVVKHPDGKLFIRNNDAWKPVTPTSK